MIRISNLTIANSDRKIINNLSLSIKENEIKGLTGPSGAGKTTLLKAIMSLNESGLTITNGQIEVCDTNINNIDHKKASKLLGNTIGYIPQNPITSFFPDKTIGNQMVNNLLLKKIDKREAKKIIMKNIVRANFEDPIRILNSYPSELSGGMLQRIAIVNIYIMRPQIILADEPTSALDICNKDIFLEALLELKKISSILFVSHDIKSIKKISDSIEVMIDGSILYNKDRNNIKYDEKSVKNLWIREFIKEFNENIEEEWNWQSLI